MTDEEVAAAFVESVRWMWEELARNWQILEDAWDEANSDLPEAK